MPLLTIFGAGAATFSTVGNPFAVPLDDVKRNLAVNTISVYAAAQQAVLGFAELPETASRTFFYTGNVLNVKALPQFLESGAGKSASAHMMMAAAAEYKETGFK